MFQKIANILSIVSFLMVASMSGGTYFAYKYFTSDQFKTKVMNEIMEGKVTPSQFGSFVTALKIKGETPEEIAGIALYLASGASSFTTGETVTVDGGQTLGPPFNPVKYY